jgi:hypothetical protein
MKRFMTVIAICGCLLGLGVSDTYAACATPDRSLYWDVAGSSIWENAANWSGAAACYPGDTASTYDDARIDETTATAPFTVSLSSTLTEELCNCTVSGGTSSNKVTIHVTNSDANAHDVLASVSGTLTIGNNGSANASYVEKTGNDDIQSQTITIVGPSATNTTTMKVSSGVIETTGS